MTGGAAPRPRQIGDGDRAALRTAILELLSRRDPRATICPSDAARAVAGDASFRPLMDDTRAVAAELVREGRIEVTQRGAVVDVTRARGPVRLRLVTHS